MWLREHKLLATVALLLVIAAFSLVWRSRDQNVRLTNGGEIFIRSVSYGKTDRWITGPIWKRLIASVLPQNKVPQRMRTRVWTLASTNDVLFLWLEWRSTNVTNITNLIGAVPVPGIVDPESRLESAPLHLQYWIPVSSNRALMAFQVTSFPRRSPTLLLRFYDRKANPAWKPVAETTLRNPARVTVARAAPIAHRDTNGLRAFTLTSFTTGLEDRSSPAYSPLTWTVLELVASGPDDTAGSWFVQSVQCSDATGNLLLDQRPREPFVFNRAPAPPDRPHALITGALWPSDPWTVNVTLAPSGVPTEDRVTFRGLRIPDLGVTNALTNEMQIHGSTVRLLWIAGSPSPTVAATNWLLRTRKAVTVMADIKPAMYTDELRYVRATDDRGTNVFRLGSLPKVPQEMRLLVSKDAQSLDLELGVRRLRQVRFTALPSVSRTNARAWIYPDLPGVP